MPVKVSWPLVAAIIHPNIGGWAGSYLTQKNIKPWYEVIKLINFSKYSNLAGNIILGMEPNNFS